MIEYANSRRKERTLATIKVRRNRFGIIILDGTVDGKRHRLSTGKKADDRLMNWYRRHAEDEFFKIYDTKMGRPNRGSITFREYGLMVLEITKSNRNEFTQKEELQRFERLCETFGERDIDTIKASDIAKWQSECGLSPKTIRNYRSTLNKILEMALSDDLVTKNPLRFIKAPKKRHKPVEFFTLDQIQLLLEKSTGQMRNLLAFNFVSGLRGSELIALRWNDIDFNSKTIRVDTRIREGIEDVTKSDRVRILDMLPLAERALRSQWKATGLKNDFVFLNQYGKSYQTPDTISRQLRELCRECGLKPKGLHTIRKSCNTMLKQYGFPQDWILDQMGHVEDGVNREFYTGRIKPDMSKVGTLPAH